MKPDNVTGSPLNPQNWNLYSYVRGNPVNMNDPTGHEPPADVTTPSDTSPEVQQGTVEPTETDIMQGDLDQDTLDKIQELLNTPISDLSQNLQNDGQESLGERYPCSPDLEKGESIPPSKDNIALGDLKLRTLIPQEKCVSDPGSGLIQGLLVPTGKGFKMLEAAVSLSKGLTEFAADALCGNTVQITTFSLTIYQNQNCPGIYHLALEDSYQSREVTAQSSSAPINVPVWYDKVRTLGDARYWGKMGGAR